jgi:hypothetical protein
MKAGRRSPAIQIIDIAGRGGRHQDSTSPDDLLEGVRVSVRSKPDEQIPIVFAYV